MRRVLIVAAVGLLVLSGCTFRGLSSLPLPGSPPVGSHSYVVTAEFANALTLVPDETVRYDGVVVGRVESVARDGWHARVGLRIDAARTIPANVEVHIGQSSLLGEKFVALEAAAAPMGQLAAGAMIPLSRTSSGREVEQVLGALALLLNGGGLPQIRTITVQLRDALGNDSAARDFVHQLDGFVTTLDASRGQIIATLEHLNSIGSMVTAESADVTRALDQLARATGSLADQRRAVMGMLGHLDRFSVVASRVVRTSGDAVVADLNALKPTLAALAAAGNDLPRAIEPILSFPFPDAVLTAIVGDFVNLDVLLDLSPLIIAGQSAGNRNLLTGPLGGLLNTLVPPTGGSGGTTTPLGGLAGQLGSIVGGTLGGAL